MSERRSVFKLANLEREALLGTIERPDRETGQAVVTVGKRRLRLDLTELRALDHAYAVTSHRTDNRMALARAVSREQERESALSIAESTPTTAALTTPTANRSRTPSALDIAENSQRSRDPVDAALARTARSPRSAPQPDAVARAFAQALARLAGLDPPKIPACDRTTRDR